MELEESFPVVKKDYLIKTYEVCEPVHNIDHVYPPPLHRIFHKSVPIMKFNREFEPKTILIKIYSSHGKNYVRIPSPVRDYLLEDCKSTFIKKKLIQELSRMHMITHDDTLHDAVVCTKITQQSKQSSIAIAEGKGPFLIFQRDGSILIEYSLAVVPDAKTIGTRNQTLALKFMALALNDYSLTSPGWYRGSVYKFIDVISKQPSNNPPHIEMNELKCNLLPFQRDTVSWMLNREGMQLIQPNATQPMDPAVRDVAVAPPLGWRLDENSNIYFNPYLLKTSSTPPKPEVYDNDQNEFGGVGILAEEMGLGKTCEVIALILLNPRKLDFTKRNNVMDYRLNRVVKKSKATLIVTPRSISVQWCQELQRFAPHLKIVQYIQQTDEFNARDMLDADVIVITYKRLSAELDKALYDPNKHPTRFKHAIKNDPKRQSVLTRIQFWRVVLDEAQMVNSGVSDASRIVQKIPRVHAWAVSGTPIKSGLEDLRGLMSYFNLFPFVEGPAWERLIASPVDFKVVMELIGIRHTRAMVEDQFVLPQQYRRLMLLKFSDVERMKYTRNKEMINETLRHSSEGYSYNSMKSALNQLRQLCCQLISDDKISGTGGSSENVLLTMTQVLYQLIDDTETSMLNYKREIIVLEQERGQVLDQADKMDQAIEIWTDLISDIDTTMKHVMDMGNSASFKLRLRNLQELLHRCYFFLGTGFFRSSQRMRLKLSETEINSEESQKQLLFNSEQELKYYKLAENVREIILKDSSGPVDELITKLEVISPTMLSKIFPMKPSIDAYDQLANLISKIESRLRELLTKPLIDEEIEVTEAGIQSENDAYSKTLDEQEEASLLIDLLEITLRDRAAAFNNKPHQVYNLSEAALTYDLVCKRNEILMMLKMPPSVSTILNEMELQNANMNNTWNFLKSEISECQRKFGIIRDLYNARINFYKQLQTLSDQVTDLELAPFVDKMRLVGDKLVRVRGLHSKVDALSSRLRYLRNLREEDLSAGQTRDGGSENICLICQELYEYGCVGPCCHPFCEDCIEKWLRNHKTCPTCKSSMTRRDLIRFNSSYRNAAAAAKANQEGQAGAAEDNKNILELGVQPPPQKKPIPSLETTIKEETVGDDKKNSLYSMVSDKFYNEVLRTLLIAKYGIKIDMIVKMIIYLRSRDPTTQIVVFSQWNMMLKKLSLAISQNNVKVAYPENGKLQAVDEFRNDPSIACLLLSSKHDVAGLTLVNANHVFLCEPMLSTALELQAISRIRRIGQTRITYIWQFCIQGTVEQSMLGIATMNRLNMEESIGKENMDSMVLTDAMSRGDLIDKGSGSEVIDYNLLYKILTNQK